MEETKIYFSIKENNLGALDRLLTKQKDIFSIRPYSQSLIIHACFENNIQITEYLIKKGFDVNEKDNNGFTPLHACAEYNFAELAELLLKNGAIPDTQDSFGNTPLMKATLHWDKNIDFIKIILKYKGNPDKKNNSGSSPRSLADKMKSDQLIKLFNLKKE